MSSLENRKTELDILRLLATLAVITIHLCGGPVRALDVRSVTYIGLNGFESTLTWSVPIFVMISGCLFLSPEKEISVKKIYSKYIKHLVICFLVWTAVYQLAFYTTTGTNLNWKGILSEFVIGAYPFWYIFMLIGLYMVVPFLRPIAKDRRLTRYFLLLFIVFELIVNYGVKLPLIGGTIASIYEKSNFYFVLGYTGYYLLGYYLANIEVSRKQEIGLYAMGLLCMIAGSAITVWQSWSSGVHMEWFFVKYRMPNVIIVSAAIYTFFVKRVSKIHFSPKTRKLLKNLSDLSLGVYLVHATVIHLLGLLPISMLDPSPVIMLPVLVGVVYFICLGVTLVVRKIPVIGKNIT